MSHVAIVGLGIAAGLHGALYGAYKDSPHESFLWRRFAREIVLALIAAVALPMVLPAARAQSAFVIYLTIFALARIATEFWKLFLRVEPQDGFRIPTQMHYIVGIVNNPVIRLVLGIGFLGAIYGCYRLFALIPPSTPPAVRGLLVGFGLGVTEAMGGGYKDGGIEGFSWFKFFKSPSLGAIGGLIVSGHATDLVFLIFATIGTMRMLLELLFKMLRPDYTPGKFKSMIGPFPEWQARRRHFLVPYAGTWLLYVVLCSHPNW